MFKRPESVLVVLYDQYHRVLVLQRQDDPSFWQSVTGTIEEGEYPLDTAYREVEEELGLRLNKAQGAIKDCQQVFHYEIRPQWRYRYPPGTTTNTEHAFCTCIDASSPLTLSEHLQYEWLTKNEALARLWSASNREAVRQFVPDECGHGHIGD